MRVNGGKIEVFDFDLVQRCWYLVDVGCAVFGLLASIHKLFESNDDIDGKRLAHAKKLVTALVQAYDPQTDMEQLRQCCVWRRDFVVSYLEFVIDSDPNMLDRKEAWFNERIETLTRDPHYEFKWLL